MENKWIKDYIRGKIGLYERRVERLQERELMRTCEDRELTEEKMRWYWKEEELIEILQEILKREGKLKGDELK